MPELECYDKLSVQVICKNGPCTIIIVKTCGGRIRTARSCEYSANNAWNLNLNNGNANNNNKATNQNRVRPVSALMQINNLHR